MRKMRMVTMFAAAALAVAGLAVSAHEGHDHGKGVTVQGEVLDMACYVAHDGKGPSHAACAKKCLKQGQPMGLLAKDGTVYILFADHADGTAYDKTKEFGGANVEIQGEPADKGGFKGITVKSVKPL